MPQLGDWMFWIAGCALGSVSLWILAWSLFNDRARGRRRCPKCWYDLSGTPGPENLVCSECGYRARRERKFFKTRRRWRIALCGLLTGALAVGTASAPTVQRHGWTCLAPTSVIVILGSHSPTKSPAVMNELARRVEQRQLSSWQWQYLLNRAHDAIKDCCTVTPHSRIIWPRDVPVHYSVDVTRRKTNLKWFDALPVRVSVSPRTDDGNVATNIMYGWATRPRPARSGYLPAWEERTVSAGMPPHDATRLKFEIELAIHTGFTPIQFHAFQEELPLMIDETLALVEPVKVILDPPTLPPSLRASISQPSTWVSKQDKVSVTLQIERTESWVGSSQSHSLAAEFKTGDASTVESKSQHKRIAVGMRIELLHENDVIASTEVWPSLDQFRKLPVTLQADRAMMQQVSAVQGTLQLRLRGDPTIALRDFMADGYWDGEVTIPVTWRR
jgi:hypothetical protein